MSEVRLIDANELIAKLNEKKVVGRFNTVRLIEEAPTIDTGDAKYLEERDADAYESGYIQGLSERAVGKWIFDGVCFSTTKFKCSICHLPELEKTNYCPNCGARMKEDRR